MSQGTLRFGAQEVASESILEFSALNGFDAVSAPGFEAYTLSFKSERLSESARILELPVIEKEALDCETVRYPDPFRLAALRGFLASLFQGAEQQQAELAKPAFTATIESELPLVFLGAWTESSPPSRARIEHRFRVVRKAKDFIFANAKAPITVADVCLAASCSLSTLGRAFQEHFGVSPKLYLTAVRLAGVRRTLMTGEAPVGDAAVEWGFWHLSKFAADYRRMYGELPSATLNRVAGLRSS